jgi:hypothetical protein
MEARRIANSVDSQITDLENDLRDHIDYHLLLNIDQAHWREMDRLTIEDNNALYQVVEGALEPFMIRYQNVRDVTILLEYTRNLLFNIIWAGMNVPWPRNATLHTEAVIDNAFAAWDREIHAMLRTEMIMANHHAEILQRNWRRIIGDPDHPACKRRLEYEFNEFREEQHYTHNVLAPAPSCAYDICSTPNSSQN